MGDPRLVLLRVELYTAAQILKGEDLAEFQQLIGEIHDILGFEASRASGVPPGPPAVPTDGKDEEAGGG